MTKHQGLFSTENEPGSVKEKKEKKNRKKDKENGSGSVEAGNHNDIDAPDAVVSILINVCKPCQFKFLMLVVEKGEPTSYHPPPCCHCSEGLVSQ